MFPGAQIVFCGIDRRELAERVLPSNVRGVLVKRNFSGTLDAALALHPYTQQVVVIAGTSGFDTRVIEQARQEFRAYESRVTFTYPSELTLPELLAEVGRLPSTSLVLFAAYFQDGSGKPFVPHEVVARVSAAASVPTYGFSDQYLGRGIVGGNLYTLGEHGSEVAKVILGVLAGTAPPGGTFSELAASKFLFDWRQMHRWGIGASHLPAGSEIYFRDPSLWEQYRREMITVLAVVLLQAALISWLLYERRRRLLAEIAVRNSMSELTYLNRLAGAGVLSASIAHEVNQPLATIVNSAAAARNWLAAKTPDLDEARDALAEIYSAGRRAGDIIHNLRAMFRKDTHEMTAVDVNADIMAVLSLAGHELHKHEIALTTRLAVDLPAVNAVDIQLQQVLLNLVMNAIDAMASAKTSMRELRVSSALSRPGTVHVTVEDSGPGIGPSNLERIFDPMFTTKARGMGMGLAICRSIIEGHGGRIWAAPDRACGATFHIELPTKAAGQEPDFGRARARSSSTGG